MRKPVNASVKGHGQRRVSQWPAWHADLLEFRHPNGWIAAWQVSNTLLPYAGLWYLMAQSMRRGYPYALTLGLAAVAAAFLVRLFVLFHDCVHGSFCRQRRANTILGYLFGMLLFTPFEDWRFSHLRHHASYADLDGRGFGDIWTLTLTEYEQLSPREKRVYRLYRNPLIMFGFGAVLCFLLYYRFPTRTAKRKQYSGVILTNLLIALMVLFGCRILGVGTYLLIQIPVIWMAGATGVWLFYVQHQFDGVYWARREDWSAMRAALEGSSFYQLPAVLRWFSGSIGYHHVHHLSARIPNYRMKACWEAIPALRDRRPLTLRDSLASAGMKLWDEQEGKLIGFPKHHKRKTA